MKWKACLAVLGAALLAGGCAKRSIVADVDAGLIIPVSGAGVEMPEDQQFLFPTPVVRNPLPDYPASLVGHDLPDQVVCIQIVIDEGGAVPSSSFLFDVPGCPDAAEPPRPEFLDATQASVADWQFLAGVVCTYPKPVEKNADCSGDGVVMQPVAVKLSYRFTFRLINGKPVVEGE